MHFDLAHAVVAGILIMLTIVLVRHFRGPGETRRFDWVLFAVIFVVMFLFNLIWPYG